jgi:hypothetical protein
LIVLPKNFFRYVDDEFSWLIREVKWKK